MTEKMFKAIRPDGTDFRTGTVRWAPEKTKARKGRTIKHPTAKTVGTTARDYLSVSVDPVDLPGSSWPMRMLVVEPVGEAVTPEPSSMPNKRAAVAFRVVEEVSPNIRFGPQGEQIGALLDRCRTLTYDEARRVDAARDATLDAALDAARGAALDAARGAAWDAAWGAAWDAARGAAWGAAWDAARGAAWGAAWDAARGAAWGAAWDAARGLLVRDLIGKHGFTQAHYDTLTGPWRRTIGPIHPDDAPLS